MFGREYLNFRLICTTKMNDLKTVYLLKVSIVFPSQKKFHYHLFVYHYHHFGYFGGWKAMGLLFKYYYTFLLSSLLYRQHYVFDNSSTFYICFFFLVPVFPRELYHWQKVRGFLTSDLVTVWLVLLNIKISYYNANRIQDEDASSTQQRRQIFRYWKHVFM